MTAPSRLSTRSRRSIRFSARSTGSRRREPRMNTRPRGGLARWGDRLALQAAAPHISLGEGDTPCVESLTIGPAIGLGSLHFKLEGLNPTGSFKDRGMVAAVAAALHEGSR